MGRSRGGLTSEIRALVDADGRPVALKITEGQAHDPVDQRDILLNVAWPKIGAFAGATAQF